MCLKKISGDLKISNNLLPVKYLLAILIILISTSCISKTGKKTDAAKPGNAEMENLNRYMIQKDRERIQNYIERKKLKMIQSPTGLWYQILKEGEGTLLTDNSRFYLKYTCSLLDGTLCYSSDILGPKDLTLGKSPIEPGLNEGLRLLRLGSEAIFILPPFLAYGLPGDGKMVPPRAVIVYNVNILRSE
jgi:FKBP-type peptidyl-prolyl cis-trans isomerase FkpA